VSSAHGGSERRASTLGGMPSYRLIFPTPADVNIENTHTAVIESDTVYEVGAEIRHRGKLWRVSSAPLEQPTRGEIADLMVWPAE
jgi:hypothetical protein